MLFKKKSIYLLYLFILTGVLLELAPYLVAPIILGRSFDRGAQQAALLKKYAKGAVLQEEGNGQKKKDEYLGDHILHPYIGFTSIPAKDNNKFCFPGPDPLTHRSNDTLQVCLTGGSVAFGLHPTLKRSFEEHMDEMAFFKGKEVNIVVVALGGFKQPQQLMALNYFLSLGAEYDIVINLDGFNEVVLPYSDNLPMNVYPSYPRHWNIYSRKRLNSRVQLLLSKKIGLDAKQQNANRFFVERYLYKSNFCLLIWSVLSNNNSTAAFQLEEQLKLALKESETDYQSTGPTGPMGDTTGFFLEQAQLWARSSMLMAGLGEQMGFEYFHFLQPDQYVEDSKVLTEKELQIAFEHGPFVYKEAVVKGYPLLVEQGIVLKGKGVDFKDLTMVFKDESRSVYIDKCCHFNELGNKAIAEAIVRTVLDHFKKNPNGAIESQ